MNNNNKTLLKALLCPLISTGLIFSIFGATSLSKTKPIKVCASDNESTVTFSVKGWNESDSRTLVTEETTGYDDNSEIRAVMNNYTAYDGKIVGGYTTSQENFYIYNTDEIPGNIVGITLTATGKSTSASFKKSMYAAVGEVSQSDVTDFSDGVECTPNSLSYSWTFDAEDNYKYFKLYTNKQFVSGTITETVINVTYVSKVAERTLQSIYIDGKATKLDYKAGETFNPAGLKVIGRYQDLLGDTEITTGIEWLIEPETLSAGTTSVEVIAKVGDFTSEPFTVNNLTVVKAITIPDILPLDFPKTAETAWLNENRVACYFSSSELVFDNGVNTTTASSTIELRFEDGNYKYIVLGPLSITFNMEGENLASITFVGLNETYAQYAGTYRHIHVTKEINDKVDSTCLEAGHEIYYECDCGKYFSDEALTQEITNLDAWLAEDGDGYIAPKGHSFGGEVTYTWNDETHECTASWKCQREGCTETQSELASIENGKVVYVKDTDATTESNEKGHYEATFSISDFKKQSTPANSVEIPDTKLPLSGLSGGAIAGIAAGSVVGVCLITYVAMFFVWKKNEKALKFLKPSFAWINKKIFRK